MLCSAHKNWLQIRNEPIRPKIDNFLDSDKDKLSTLGSDNNIDVG